MSATEPYLVMITVGMGTAIVWMLEKLFELRDRVGRLEAQSEDLQYNENQDGRA